MTIERAIEILNPEHREHYDSIETVNEACRMGMEALEKMRWIPGSVRPTKEGEIAVCLSKHAGLILGEVISYQGELIWEEHNLFGGVFTPVYWLRIPELPKEEERTACNPQMPRVLRGKNPTPVSEAEAMEMLVDPDCWMPLPEPPGVE